MLNPPFEIGQQYLIQTITLYYIGRVKARGVGWILLESASWVHWTGRLSILAGHKKFRHRGFGQRTPRTEYVGDYGVNTNSVVGWIPWDGGELPAESVE